MKTYRKSIYVLDRFEERFNPSQWARCRSIITSTV